MIIIVDGNNTAHRCRHVFELSNKGVDVSVTYGFMRVIVSIIERFQPDGVIVCWDGGTPVYRIKANEQYKANRTQRDEFEYLEFVRQVRELTNTLPKAGIVCVRKDGAEADDLMYHASRICHDKSMIITSDNDLLQAVSKDVIVHSPIKDILYTEELVFQECGVPPRQIPHWKALRGDGSDNIQGVPGIGPKTATKLFQEFGSIAAIWNAATGHRPGVHGMGLKTAESIRKFGWDRLVSNVVVIKLLDDRVGAKLAVLDAIDAWEPADVGFIKKYLVKNAFTSLIGSVGVFSKLMQPAVLQEVGRTPVVCARRVPCR